MFLATLFGVHCRDQFSLMFGQSHWMWLSNTARPTETKAMPFRSVATSPDSAKLSGIQVDPGTCFNVLSIKRWWRKETKRTIKKNGRMGIWLTLVYPLPIKCGHDKTVIGGFERRISYQGCFLFDYPLPRGIPKMGFLWSLTCLIESSDRGQRIV